MLRRVKKCMKKKRVQKKKCEEGLKFYKKKKKFKMLKKE